MALERVFACRRTLTRLRSGPLGQLLEGFGGWLLERGFSRSAIRTHFAHLSHLDEYLARSTARSRETVTAQEVERFLQAYPSWCRNRGSLAAHLRRVRFSLHRFVDYLDHTGCFVPAPQPQPIYQSLLDGYLEWMRRYQHAAAGTLKLRARSISPFLRWLGPDATPQALGGLRADRVEGFFLAYAQTVGQTARRSMQAALRTFFRFCLHHGYIHQPLDRAVPTLRTYQLASVPRGLTDAQAQHVLQSIPRHTDVGRRDTAIVQLLYTYGVRGGQVRALRLQQVDWAQNQIRFPACKQGKDTVLPLLPEVGQSLLDYVRHSRPPSAYPQVFLTARAPFHPLPSSSSLSALVARRIRAAGIEIARRGAHAFRHGFATRMLHQGQSLKAIADVLGHRHLGSTFVYTKVDVDALRQVALEWPEERSR
jgi:site-specific recombinase XerD